MSPKMWNKVMIFTRKTYHWSRILIWLKAQLHFHYFILLCNALIPTYTTKSCQMTISHNSILWFDRKNNLPFIQNLNLTKSSTTFFSIIFISLSSSAILELPLELKLESLLSSLELQHWASRTKSATDFKWIKHIPWRVIKSGTFSSLPSTFGSIQSPERKWICNLAILSL